MRKYLLVFLIIIVATLCFPKTTDASPYYDFAYAWGGVSIEFVRDIEVDSSGNIYVGGVFSEGTVDFDGTAGTDIHASNGSYDSFITKYNANGTYAWTHTWGGSNLDGVDGIDSDGSGNIYIYSYFTGSNVDFDDSLNSDLHSSNGSTDIALTRFSSSGTYDWTYTIGGAGSDLTERVVIDTTGDILLVGYFSNTDVDFNWTGGTDLHSSNGSSDAFLTKYNSNGTYAWTYTWGSTSSDYARGLSIDSNDNIFVAGGFEGTVDFDGTGGVDNHTANGGEDSYVVKYNANGTYGWGYTWGGGGFNYDEGWGVANDSSGNVYVLGYFAGSNVDLDGTAGSSLRTSNGGIDAFLCKYNANGSFGFAYTWGGTGNDLSYNATVDDGGDVLIAGIFHGNNVDFDGTVGQDLHSATGSGYDSYLSKYLSDATYGWTYIWGGSADDYNYDLDTYSNVVVVGGSFEGSDTDLDGTSGVHAFNSAGLSDAYLANYENDINPPTISLTPYSPDPTSDSTPTWSGVAEDSEGKISLVEYQMDGVGGLWISCTADDGVFDEDSEAFTCGDVALLSDGSHTIYARATDNSDNTTGDSEATDTILVDTVPPSIAISSEGVLPDGSAVLYGLATDATTWVVSVEYSLDGINWYAAVPVDGAFNENQEQFSAALGITTPGSYTIRFRATDAVDLTSEIILYPLALAETGVSIKGPVVIGLMTLPMAFFFALKSRI